MSKDNKGFTLVELIAILVILIIVFLIAINRVNDIMDKSEINSIKANSISYVNAANGVFTLSNAPKLYPDTVGLFSVDELDNMGVKVKGTKPDSGYIYNIDNKTIYGCLMYGKRRAVIENNKLSTVDTRKCELETGYNSNYRTYIGNYSGSEQVVTVEKSGEYLIEAWGAQGGSSDYNSFHAEGGYGAYARGFVYLNKDDVLYINVGGKGASVDYSTSRGAIFDKGIGYNGGGYANYSNNNSSHGGGGGATSIALQSGLLKNLSSSLDSILIVAAGGGGASTHANYPSYSGNGGSAGGYVGNDGITANTTCYNYGTGGNQESVGTYIACASDGRTNRNNAPAAPNFGLGSNATSNLSNSSTTYGGGGAGLYGGQSGYHAPGGGGSSYIGNTLLTRKSMYCYNCLETFADDTLTKSTNNYSEDPTAYYAKAGDGYAKITFIKEQ